MPSISYYGLTKAQALCALYEKATCQGMGILQYSNRKMTIEEAEALLNEGPRFDYLKGRVMKVDLSNDNFDDRLYNRDNGPGAAEWALMEYATDPTR